MQRRSEIITREGRLYHLGIAPEEIRRTVFLVGDPARAYTVASRFESIEHRVTHREFVTLTGLCRGLPMSVVGTGIGTGNVEIALAKISVSGVGTPCRHDLPDNQTAPQSWVPGRV